MSKRNLILLAFVLTFFLILNIQILHWFYSNSLFNFYILSDQLSQVTCNATELSEIIQKRLYLMQHHENCTTKKKLLCDFDPACGCGFGCTLHHFVYCFIMAYETERTLIVEYSGNEIKDKWNFWFRPFGSCNTNYTEKYVNWNENSDPDYPLIKLPRHWTLLNRSNYLYKLPKDMTDVLNNSFKENAYAWWIGQILKYVLKPTIGLKDRVKEMEERIQFRHPIVGVQIRRTDKVIAEARAFPLEDYMKHVEQYFDLLEKTEVVKIRRVYLATDEATIFSEAQEKYPQYEFLGDRRISESAATDTRKSNESVLGIILDIHFLSLCDYIVCTMSSNVCRTVHELQQTLSPNSMYNSLDGDYTFS